MTPPVFDDDPGLLQRIEYLTVEQFITKLRVEALAVAVLPGAARFDVGGLGSDGRNPLLYGPGDELWAVVRSHIARRSPQDEEIGEHVDHRGRVELAIDADRQTLPSELVDDIEHAILSPVMSAIFDEVV